MCVHGGAEGRAGQTASVSAHDAQGVHTDQSSKASGTNSQKSLQQDRASRQQEHQQHASGTEACDIDDAVSDAANLVTQTCQQLDIGCEHLHLVYSRHARLPPKCCMEAAEEPCKGPDDCAACAEASPRVRLTPHGIVHMGLSSASPTALRRWQSRRNHSGASPKDQNPQQRHAALVETTAESHVPTQHTASGSDQGSEGSARGPETAQAAHLPGSPRRPPARLRSSGASGGLPYSPLPGSLKAHPSVEDVQHTSNSLQAELELTGVGECTDINGTQMGANSSRNLQAEAAEDEELLSLRPTRDFVENFNQHTSFHRRKIMRSTKKGNAIPGTGSWPSPPLCGPRVGVLQDLSHCRLTHSMVMQPCIGCQPMSTEPELNLACAHPAFPRLIPHSHAEESERSLKCVETATRTSKDDSISALDTGGGRDASGKEARSSKRRRRGSRVRGEDKLQTSIHPQTVQVSHLQAPRWARLKWELWALDAVLT